MTIMSEFLPDRVTCCICSFGLGAIVGVFLVSALTIERMRNDAIKAGVAHYEINPTTGESKFVYNQPAKP